MIDVISAVTNKSAQYAAKQLRNVIDKYPDVCQNMTHVKFTDARGRKGQKETPVACVKGIVEVLMLIPGSYAARVRKQAALLLCRWLGGDISIVDEVCRTVVG